MGGPPISSLPPAAPEGQRYCLRWNNHKSNLVEILDDLIKKSSYVDCTIVVDDAQFKAHRVVLAVNSPYFRSILPDVPMDHCSIIFPGVKAFEMRALLEYMYTGEVEVTQSQIPKVMRIAEELEVKGLFDLADLKEKFNKQSDEHAERAGNPYASSSMPSAPYSSAATSSSPSSASAAATSASNVQNGSKDYHHSQQVHAPSETQTAAQHNNQQQQQQHHHHNSSSVISTSSNISPSAAPTSSSSPPYSTYKSPYSNLYNKSPPASITAQTSTSNTATAATLATSNAATLVPQSAAERSQQWPLSPSAAAAAAMLSSVYESAPDMNPLKRKKLSSISSMLMQRDTPILRNVLAQANPADSSQALPLLLPGATESSASKSEKSVATTASAEKNSSHAGLVGANAHNNNHSFNGSDYSSDKKYHDEPHSPYTDRSFDDDGAFDPKGNFTGNFGSSAANQKPEWKRYKQYTRTDIMSAIQCVREGMSALQASRKFGVPSRTLYDKVKKLGITTGRPMNRAMKRSPSSVESSAAFPYAHGYGQSEPLMSSMHEGRSGAGSNVGDEREPKDPRDLLHHHMPPTIPHSAAALLDHAFLQQALESNRGGEIAGREALHAMALAAAAHAAANQQRLSTTSPGPNSGAPPPGSARSPSPSAFSLKYARPTEHELIMAAAEREREHRMMIENEIEMEREREREREVEMERDHQNRERELNDACDDDDDDDEDDRVEDLSVTRKDCVSPSETARRPESPYSPPPPPTMLPPPTAAASGNSKSSSSGVIMPPISSKHTMLSAAHSSRRSSSGSASGDDDEFISAASMKRELIIDEGRAD